MKDEILKILISILGILAIFLLTKIMCSKIYFITGKKLVNDGCIKVSKKVFSFRYIKKLNSLVSETKKIYEINIRFFSIHTMIFFSLIYAILVACISNAILKVPSAALFLSIFSFFIPSYIFKYAIYLKKQKILNSFPTYIINLKNYISVKNDIIMAFKNVIPDKSMSKYIDRFIVSIDNGIQVYDAFETLKKTIDIQIINELFNALYFCYINRRKL
jgi:hypothetical protein